MASFWPALLGRCIHRAQLPHVVRKRCYANRMCSILALHLEVAECHGPLWCVLQASMLTLRPLSLPAMVILAAWPHLSTHHHREVSARQLSGTICLAPPLVNWRLWSSWPTALPSRLGRSLVTKATTGIKLHFPLLPLAVPSRLVEVKTFTLCFLALYNACQLNPEKSCSDFCHIEYLEIPCMIRVHWSSFV